MNGQKFGVPARTGSAQRRKPGRQRGRRVCGEGDHVLSRIVNRYARFDLLVVDDLGYLPLPSMAAQLLFQVVAERSERKSTVITTNRPFGEWTEVIADPRLCRAFVERLTFRAIIVDTGDKLVRLLETLEAQADHRGRKGVVAAS